MSNKAILNGNPSGDYYGWVFKGAKFNLQNTVGACTITLEKTLSDASETLDTSAIYSWFGMPIDLIFQNVTNRSGFYYISQIQVVKTSPLSAQCTITATHTFSAGQNGGQPDDGDNVQITCSTIINQIGIESNPYFKDDLFQTGAQVTFDRSNLSTASQFQAFREMFGEVVTGTTVTVSSASLINQVKSSSAIQLNTMYISATGSLADKFKSFCDKW